jgi:oxalate---CoA ligase
VTSIGPRVIAAGSFQASGAWDTLAKSFPTVADVLENHAMRAPDRAALIGAPGTITYRALLARVRAQSVSLTRQAGRGTAVALALADPVDMATALLSAMAGHVAVPLNPTLRSADAASALAASSARVLVIDDGTPSRLVRAAHAIGLTILRLSPSGRLDPPGARDSRRTASAPGDPALLLTTSGTTGQPKLVTLSQANVIAAAGASGFAYALGPDDVRLNIMPLYHVQGIVGALLASLVAGGAIACCQLTPRQTLDQLTVTGATWFSASPTMHHAILGALAPVHGTARRLPSGGRLRFVRVGSAALTAGLRASLERFWNVPVIESYGMTEAHQIASTPLSGQPPTAGAIGAPVGADVTVAPTVEAAPQLWVRGPVVASRVTAADDDGEPPAPRTPEELQLQRGGWLPTGDFGSIDEFGSLRIRGRIKEIISVGGEKVSPHEVEKVLCGHPSVRDAVVLGVPDKVYGETVAALVVPRIPGQLDEAILRRHVLEHLAPVKCPTRIAVVAAIRTGRSGKVERQALAREWFGIPAVNTPIPNGREGGAC